MFPISNAGYSRLLALLALSAALMFTLSAVPILGAVWVTVTLSDGRTFSGEFLGGTEDTVKLGRDDSVYEIPVSAIGLIAFGEEAEQQEVHLGLTPAPPPADSSTNWRVPPLTPLRVKLGQPLSTVTSQEGARFMAIVAQDIVVDSQTVVRTGLAVIGQVAGVRPGGRIKGDPRLALVLDSLHLPTGSLPLKTRVWIEPADSPGKPGTGATSQFLTEERQLLLPSGTELEFILVQPLLIPKQ